MIAFHLMSAAGRSVGSLMLVVFAASMARAEGGGGTNDVSTGARLHGVATALPTATGLVSIGGPALRRLAPGGRRWETLHVVPGDNLYRVAADEGGRLLAAWSKDRFFHLVTPGQNQVVSFPKPAAPPGVRNFQIASIDFLPDGRAALVVMTGNVMVTTGPVRGPSWSTSAYRVALDGKSEVRLLFRLDHGYRLHVSPFGVVFALPKNPGRRCDHGECHIAEIVAYEIAGDVVTRKTLYEPGPVQLSRARLIRGSDDRRVALLLDALNPRRLEILRWRYGEARASVSPRPLPPGYDRTTLFLTRADAMLELRVRDGLLEVWRQAPHGDQPVANLREMQEVDTGLYGVGERGDGTLWLHWGDHIGLLAPGKAPRGYSIKALLPRRSEWTGNIYVRSPEQLWVGIDGTGRHYARVDFADVDRGAVPWPAGTLIERGPRGEHAGYDPKDPSTSDRLHNAATLRQMPGGLFSIGGSALRRLTNGSRRWETLLAIPKDNLYRVAADDNGRLLAAWEKDPSIHLFSPGRGPHVSFLKPGLSAGGLEGAQVDHLAFAPNGREALVIMSRQVRSPPSRHVPEPVRFYHDSWATEAYRVALDGRSRPQLLFREDWAHRLYESKRGVVFAMPKYPGQECAHSTCFPITAIVAYEITDGGIKKHTLVTGDGFGQGYYLSQAALVKGSNDERLALVVRFTKHDGKHWLNGGRGLLRWRWGDARADYRPLPGNSALQPVWLLSRNDDFIELIEHWSPKPDRLEIRRYPVNGGERSMMLTALRKLASPHGIGERAGGGLWLQWGDHLALISPDGTARSLDLDPLLQRGTEWARALSYVSTPESLWVGLDGRGRGYVRVDLAEAERRSKLWR